MTSDRPTDLPEGAQVEGATDRPGGGSTPPVAVSGRSTGPPPDAPLAVDRRRFVRALAGDTVATAGTLAGVSGMVAGSLLAAARAAGDGFAALGGPPVTRPPAPARPLPRVPVPAASPVPAAPLRLDDADRRTLETTTLGLMSTNQPGSAPAVGVVRYWFDGTAFRIPGRSATARTSNLQRDPHASLTVIDPETGEALLIAGRATIAYGAAGHEGAAEVMEACGIELTDGWDAPDNRGDLVLLVLDPQRVFRRGPGERP